MKLTDLLPGAPAGVEVTSITDNTSDVQAGGLFFCVPGARRDGHDFAAEAEARGAAAVVVERNIGHLGIPQVLVPSVRASMGPVAAAFHDHPGTKLQLVGITGTNGKTTTAHILTAILSEAGKKTATIGTLSGQYTSPPALELQAHLAQLVEDGYDAVVMEVSSHALVQRRVDGLLFAVSVFTNLSQDHLDYHHSMEEYFEAKAMLFDPERTHFGVVNADDSWGEKLLARAAERATSYRKSDATNLELRADGSTFDWRGERIELPLIGEFNVSNALAAASAAAVLDISPSTIAAAITKLSPVPGRVEPVDRGQRFKALVDFAHTPDGLEKVLDVARDAAGDNAVIVVFGCGGDRDAGKRPLMAKVAERGADKVIVTSDNPRSESAAAIIDQILSGFGSSEKVSVEIERAKAINLAVASANDGDVVLVAGKGHEVTQEINGVKTPFDDRMILAKAIDERVAVERGEK